MSLFVLHAKRLAHLLNEDEHRILTEVQTTFEALYPAFRRLSEAPPPSSAPSTPPAELLEGFDRLGALMRQAIQNEPRIHVYGFETPPLVHAQASRLIARLRDARTSRAEFVASIQRAYEMLFPFAYHLERRSAKKVILVPTPVTSPVAHWALHKVPDLGTDLGQATMAVLLRGALLPSIILSREIEEHTGRVTPFALFRVQRREGSTEKDLEYVLDLKRSYFREADMEGQDLLFADPMNATGGSLICAVEFLRSRGLRFRSVKSFHVICSLKGALQTIRAIPEAEVYTLWLDPCLNQEAYILPGLGDAGDRINGRDEPGRFRDILQLIAGFGPAAMEFYRSQLAMVEKVVLG